MPSTHTSRHADATNHESAGPSQHQRRASTNADRDSPEEIEVVKGPRRAKTNALQNQRECQYWFKNSKSHKTL